MLVWTAWPCGNTKVLSLHCNYPLRQFILIISSSWRKPVDLAVMTNVEGDGWWELWLYLRRCIWGKSWNNLAWSQVECLWLSPPKEEGEPGRYNTVHTEGQAVQPVTAGDRQRPHVQLVGQGPEVWVPSAVGRILLLKGLTGAQVNGERRAIASCLLYTSHQWKTGGWICLLFLNWIKLCCISVTELSE